MAIINLTSDRIVSIGMTAPFNSPSVDLMEVRTEKGMTLIVDIKRCGHLKIGQQIDIHLEAK